MLPINQCQLILLWHYQQWFRLVQGRQFAFKSKGSLVFPCLTPWVRDAFSPLTPRVLVTRNGGFASGHSATRNGGFAFGLDRTTTRRN